MPQISASLKEGLIENIVKVQKSERVESFSQMVETLLEEAINNRNKQSLKNKPFNHSKK